MDITDLNFKENVLDQEGLTIVLFTRYITSLHERQTTNYSYVTTRDQPHVSIRTHLTKLYFFSLTARGAHHAEACRKIWEK